MSAIRESGKRSSERRRGSSPKSLFRNFPLSLIRALTRERLSKNRRTKRISRKSAKKGVSRYDRQARCIHGRNRRKGRVTITLVTNAILTARSAHRINIRKVPREAERARHRVSFSKNYFSQAKDARYDTATRLDLIAHPRVDACNGCRDIVYVGSRGQRKKLYRSWLELVRGAFVEKDDVVA